MPNLLSHTSQGPFIIFYFFLRFYLFIFREGKGGWKRERETSMCGCLPHTPYWGPGPQPRHVPWLGIELETLWLAGQHSIHWATPARANILKQMLNQNINSSHHGKGHLSPQGGDVYMCSPLWCRTQGSILAPCRSRNRWMMCSVQRCPFLRQVLGSWGVPPEPFPFGERKWFS